MRARGFLLVASKAQAAGEAMPLLLPTPDFYAALRAVGTNGANRRLDTDDIIIWFKALEKDHPFQLTGCGFDFLSCRFLAPLGDAAHFLAARLLKFCPDLRGHHADPVPVLAAQLKKSGSFFFWWD